APAGVAACRRPTSGTAARPRAVAPRAPRRPSASRLAYFGAHALRQHRLLRCDRAGMASTDTPDRRPRAVPPPADAVVTLSARGMAERVRAGELSSEALVTAHLARIAEVNPHLNAIVRLRGDAALADAREA